MVGDSDSEDDAPGSVPAGMALNHLPKAKTKPCHKRQQKACQFREQSEKDDEERGAGSAESDGESALRSVQALERQRKRGPENHTLTHWNEPTATIDRKSKPRWLFKGRYCDQ